MRNEDIDIFHELEFSTGKTLNWLMEQIFNDHNTTFAQEQLSRLAETHADMPDCLLALTYYRVLRRSIQTRSYSHYWRCCRLFEREVRRSGTSWARSMATEKNWESLETYVRSRVLLARIQCQLRAAILLPRRLELCDSAVFGMFELAYRPAA